MSKQFTNYEMWRTAAKSIGLVDETDHDPTCQYFRRKDGSIGAIWHDCRDCGHVIDMIEDQPQPTENFDPKTWRKPLFDRINRKEIKRG